MSEDQEVYKNRDVMLGEIHQSTKNTEEALKTIDEWCKDHDKKDDRRFLWGGLAIIVLAAATGVLPQIMAYFKP